MTAVAPSLYLSLELRSPVAVTAQSATVGGHETLTWIPGGQLLGAAAAAMRHQPDGALPDEVWRILMSGEVRFGDAWPDVDGQPALPAPLSLHTPKGARDPVHNLVVADRAGHGQLEQVRGRHVTAAGREAVPTRHHTLRTSIEEQGRAREGFLFGIDALAAGQRFLARIDADDPRLLARVEQLLVGREIAVGRSRSAEFGRVAVTRATRWDEPAGPGAGAERLVLWLAADVALRDPKSGAPRLQLAPADLDLPDGWSVVWERSFVRTRRYSPFNGTRHRPDLERQLLHPGSVVVLTGPPLDAAAAEALASRLRRGVGEHLQEGFGRMIANPPLLATGEVSLVAPEPTVREAPPRPDDALGRWLAARLEDVRAADEVERQARGLVEALKDRRIRRSQWGEIRRIAREARFSARPHERLVEQLEAYLSHGARLHTWPEPARRALVAQARSLTPAAVERASTLLARAKQEVTE